MYREGSIGRILTAYISQGMAQGTKTCKPLFPDYVDSVFSHLIQSPKDLAFSSITRISFALTCGAIFILPGPFANINVNVC